MGTSWAWCFFSTQHFIFWVDSPPGKPSITLICVHCHVNKYSAEITLSLWRQVDCRPAGDSHLLIYRKTLSLAWPCAPWPANHSSLSLHTPHTPVPRATEHLLQDPLPHAICCVHSLWTAVVATVGYPRDSGAWEHFWGWSSVSCGTGREDEAFFSTQRERPKLPGWGGRVGSTTQGAFQSSGNHGKWSFGSRIASQKDEHSSKCCCKIPQLEVCAQRCPCGEHLVCQTTS